MALVLWVLALVLGVLALSLVLRVLPLSLVLWVLPLTLVLRVLALTLIMRVLALVLRVLSLTLVLRVLALVLVLRVLSLVLRVLALILRVLALCLVLWVLALRDHVFMTFTRCSSLSSSRGDLVVEAVESPAGVSDRLGSVVALSAERFSCTLHGSLVGRSVIGVSRSSGLGESCRRLGCLVPNTACGFLECAARRFWRQLLLLAPLERRNGTLEALSGLIRSWCVALFTIAAGGSLGCASRGQGFPCGFVCLCTSVLRLFTKARKLRSRGLRIGCRLLMRLCGLCCAALCFEQPSGELPGILRCPRASLLVIYTFAFGSRSLVFRCG